MKNFAREVAKINHKTLNTFVLAELFGKQNKKF